MRLSEIWQQLITESRYVHPDGSEYFNHPVINFIKKPVTMGVLTAVFAQAAIGIDKNLTVLTISNLADLSLLLFSYTVTKHQTHLFYSRNAVIDRKPDTDEIKTSFKNYSAAKRAVNFNRGLFILNSILASLVAANKNEPLNYIMTDIFFLGILSMHAVNWYRHQQVINGKYQVLDKPPSKEEKLGEKKETFVALPEPSAA